MSYILRILLLFISTIPIIWAEAPATMNPELEKVEVNCAVRCEKQTIYITGTNPKNPVLLVLHGGPGYAMLSLFHKTIPELENSFTVVNWDQRGAGRSYSPYIDLDTMKLDQFVSDAHDITQYLKKKFNKNHIFVLGHSSGSMIGILLVNKYPEDYQAYIGVGQVYNFAENEMGSYDFALSRAKEALANNPEDTEAQKAVKQLEKIGRPNKKGYYASPYQYSGFQFTIDWVEYFGGSLFGKNNLDKLDSIVFDSKIYKKIDPEMYQPPPDLAVTDAPKKHRDYAPLFDGYIFSQALFNDPAVRSFHIRELIGQVHIPVYFIMGAHDYETPVDLIRNQYSNLQFPVKQYIEFSNSAHFPFFEEPQKFVQTMQKILSDNPE